MKFLLIPVLTLLLFAQTFSKWLVVIEYQMNRNYIAKNLCVNKAKPKLHCNGKCQMMKRLAEEEKQNSPNTTNNSSKIKVQDLVFIDEMNKTLVPSLTYITFSYNQEPAILKQNAPISSIFHPPIIG